MSAEFKMECPHCSASLRIALSRAGQVGRCPGCASYFAIPDHSLPDKAEASDLAQFSLTQLMTEEEKKTVGISSMSSEQLRALERWAGRLRSIGKPVVAQIEEVKYDGRLIILDDGSRWEVDDLDTMTCEFWGSYEKVVVIDGEMYNIEDCESVNVLEEY